MVTSPLAPRTMSQFWQRMVELFGPQWVEQYGAHASDEWATELAGLSGSELRRGIFACLQCQFRSPPSPSQFRTACTTSRALQAPARFQHHQRPDAEQRTLVSARIAQIKDSLMSR